MNYFASHKIIFAILTAALALMAYQLVTTQAMQSRQLLLQPSPTQVLEQPTTDPGSLLQFPSDSPIPTPASPTTSVVQPSIVKTPDVIGGKQAGSSCTSDADCGGGGCNRCQAGYGCVNICNNEP